MNDIGQELLATILDHPEDDAPRLIYADWLEENWQVERAEFIRKPVSLLWKRVAYNEWQWFCEIKKDVAYTSWIQCQPHDIRTKKWPSINVGQKLLPPSSLWLGLADAYLRRGFVDELHVGDFCTDTLQLMATQPIQKVRASAEALLEVVDQLGNCKSLRTVELINVPQSIVAVIRKDGGADLAFAGVKRVVHLPSPVLINAGLTTLTPDIYYRLGLIFGYFLVPQGVVVQLPKRPDW